MFVTKIKSVLAVVLIVGLSLGGAGATAQEKTPDKAPSRDNPLTAHGIVESVDGKKGVMTVKNVVGNDASSLLRLSASYRKQVQATVADALAGIGTIKYNPKLVNVPVRSAAVIHQGKEKLQLKDLKAGSVVSLQLAPDRRTGFAIVGIRVVGERQDEKKP